MKGGHKGNCKRLRVASDRHTLWPWAELSLKDIRYRWGLRENPSLEDEGILVAGTLKAPNGCCRFCAHLALKARMLGSINGAVVLGARADGCELACSDDNRCLCKHTGMIQMTLADWGDQHISGGPDDAAAALL